MLLLHGNNHYHAKEHEYQGTEIEAENTYRAELGLHVYGRSEQETTTGAQLLDWKTIRTKFTDQTVLSENNGYDITISANITEAGSETSRKYINATAPLPDTFAGKTITFSYATWESNVPQEDANLGLMYKVDGKSHFHGAQTITIPENATNIYIRLFLVENASTTVPVGTYTVKFTGVMLNYGDTALPWEPYTGGIPSPNPDYRQPISSIGDSSSVDVLVTGKNLIKLANKQATVRGVTIKINNGIITLTGVATGTGWTSIDIPPFTVRGKYTMSSNIKSPVAVLVSAEWGTIITQNKYNVELNNVVTRLAFIVQKGVEYNITNIKLQLERGSTATPYQPYREPQTLAINTPNGLCGIPVDTGGNYTDSTGQQWICGEVDFERGVFVQRIGKIVSYNGEQLSTKYMSTTGKLTTGASVIYILATPIETPLPAEELAAYKAIKSYPHYTHIQSVAEMKVNLKEY